MNRIYQGLLALFMSFTCPAAAAGNITAAVAANFAPTLRALAPVFEEETGHSLTLAVGSTGKHYAQIRNGAPFDVFFAADRARPEKLEQEGRAVPGSRFTYARGRLVLWSPKPGLVDDRGKMLSEGKFSYLAIANPELAPYGAASQALLTRLGLWQDLGGKLVRGENVAQTLHFVQAGAADLGLVALSQVQQLDGHIAGSYWLVPQNLYPPIEQQAVVLRSSAATEALMNFVRSPKARAIIQSHGYSEIPNHEQQ